MHKTVLTAVAAATVLCGVCTAHVSAQTLGQSPKVDFVEKILLASADTKTTDKPNDVKTTDEKVPSEGKPAEAAAPQPVIVTVAEGDSLTKIADAHSTTWVRLFNANEAIVNPNLINPGDQLRIPAPEEQLAERPLPQPVVVSAPAPVTYRAAPTYRAPAVTYPTDPNDAKAFIYSRESGNNPNATNPNGCYGLGQDCNGVLRSQCGADYACQDAYFDAYAMRRYGSWEGAQAYWQTHGWW